MEDTEENDSSWRKKLVLVPLWQP